MPNQRQATALGEPAWAPIVAGQMFRNLEAGIEFHLDRMDRALVLAARDHLRLRLVEVFGAPPSSVPDKVLKKLTNASLAMGLHSVARSKAAIEELPFWSTDLEVRPVNVPAASFVSADKLDLSEKTRCDFCSKPIDKKTGRVAVLDRGMVHFLCYCALLMRDSVVAYRSGRIPIAKLARSARAVLKANEEDFQNESSKSFTRPIETLQEFQQWLGRLIEHWSATTEVKKSFHTLYASRFNDYAYQILEYRNPTVDQVQFMTEQLSRYMSLTLAHEVATRVEQLPKATLRYFGFQERDTARPSTVPEHLRAGGAKEEQAGETWFEQALCADVDPGLFKGDSESAQQAAIRVCLMCPVQTDCLRYALKNGETEGIWGGKTPEERRNLVSNWEKGALSRFASGTPFTPDVAFQYKDKTINVEIKRYKDSGSAGQKYKEGFNVIVDLTQASDEEAKRVIDFMAGIAFASSGELQRLAPRMFMIAHAQASMNDASTFEQALRDRLA